MKSTKNGGVTKNVESYKKNHIQVEGRYLGYIAENLTSIFFIHNYNKYVIAHEKVLFVDQTGRK